MLKVYAVCLMVTVCMTISSASANEFLGGLAVGIINNKVYGHFERVAKQKELKHEKNYGVCPVSDPKISPFVKAMLHEQGREQCYEMPREKQYTILGPIIGLLVILIALCCTSEDENMKSYMAGVILGTIFDMITSAMEDD